MPNALGGLIAESDLKDLGMHTELMSDGYLKLYQAGKITAQTAERAANDVEMMKKNTRSGSFGMGGW